MKIIDRVADGLAGSVVLGLSFGGRPPAKAVHGLLVLYQCTQAEVISSTSARVTSRPFRNG